MSRKVKTMNGTNDLAHHADPIPSGSAVVYVSEEATPPFGVPLWLVELLGPDHLAACSARVATRDGWEAARQAFFTSKLLRPFLKVASITDPFDPRIRATPIG